MRAGEFLRGWTRQMAFCAWLAGGVVPLATVARSPVVDPVLVPVGGVWRFWVNRMGDSGPPERWMAADFDDSAWPAGPSGFGTGLGDEATVLPGTNLVSACFRTRFVLDDPAAVRWLLLRLDYHSGFVAWLNGREVARRGPVSEPPAWDELVPFRGRHATEEWDLTEARTTLVAGTNVLAIQVHAYMQPAPALALVAELRANFSRGPYVQQVEPHRAHLLWRTVVPATAVVEYGPGPDMPWRVEQPELQMAHRIWLTNLPAGAECFYRVRVRAGNDEAVSPTASFRTAPLSGPVRFAVVGDTGSGALPQLQVASCLATAAVDLVLHTGDLGYPAFTRALADLRCLSVYAPMMRRIPWYPTVGNHELYGPELLTPYWEAWSLPTNEVTGTSHFYSFDYGDAHFVSLFVPTLTPFRDHAAFSIEPGSAQWLWLSNDLARTDRPWRVVFLHSPLFHSGGHRFDDFNFNGVEDRLELQAWLLPLLTRFGVQVVFSGHDHSYERLGPVQSVHFFVSGGGGYVLYGLTERDRLSQFFQARFHHLECEVVGDELRIVARDRFGVVFDQAVVPRVAPPTLRWSGVPGPRWQLSWNSAPGQRYELLSASTPQGPWESVATVEAGEYQTSWPVPGPGGTSGAAFFRLRWLR
ncbi:metallophosphoesterase [Limisphaera sp. VF-2]|uniref:metallophosphoesterase family protein n=1 Tax=Limisphaera sp. VF-2 TaxID=3400418 RepID=UPI001757FAD4|nr:metallophosphoesterase [Limisphaera sp.]